MTRQSAFSRSFWWLLIVAILVSGCSHSATPPNPAVSAPAAPAAATAQEPAAEKAYVAQMQQSHGGAPPSSPSSK